MVCMMWNTAMGSTPWMWLVMGGGTVAFWVAVVFAVRWAFGGQGAHVASAPGSRLVGTARPVTPDEGQRPGTGPLDVLQNRLARGEIDVDEYARVRQALIDSDPALGRDRPLTHPR